MKNKNRLAKSLKCWNQELKVIFNYETFSSGLKLIMMIIFKILIFLWTLVKKFLSYIIKVAEMQQS